MRKLLMRYWEWCAVRRWRRWLWQSEVPLLAAWVPEQGAVVGITRHGRNASSCYAIVNDCGMPLSLEESGAEALDRLLFWMFGTDRYLDM